MNLAELRTKIDKIDKQIVNLLAKRIKITNKVGILKRENNLQIPVLEREKKLIAKLQKESAPKGLNKKYIKALYQLILKNSRENQRQLQ
tara:strand:- start:27 stop:293 length:267 start_codon:yes stop_codon:yes gene_type:complete